MEHFNSIFRTLCLAALLCITSVNASAYKVCDDNIKSINDKYYNEFMGNEKIVVIDKDKDIDNEMKDLTIPEGYAVIILPNVKVTVTGSFSNKGDLYVFGNLYLYGKSGILFRASNESNIYLIGELSGNKEIEDSKNGKRYTSVTYSPRKVTDGSFPVTPNSGWNNYWERSIACGDDFYPMGYFEDEGLTKPITDLEAWKAAHSNMDLGLKIDGTTYDKWEYWDTDEKKGFYYEDLTLEGSQDFETNQDFNVTGTFSYTRDLSGAIGVWQSWYEPFEVELTADVLTKMDAAQIAGILTDDDGNTVVAFRKMKASETMKANMPYVIRLKDQSGSLTLKYENGKKITKPVENTYKFSSMFDNFEIGGIYKARNNSDWYALSAAGAFSKLNSTALKAQRLWLTITPRTDTYNPYSSVSSKGFIGMTVLGDDETTGIAGAAESGIRSGVIFNLKGERVTSIRKGQVYIVDGKRFMAR